MSVNKNSGLTQARAMKIKERKNNYHVKNFRLYHKTGLTNFEELRVTDSTLNEGTNSLVTSEKDDLLGVVTQMSTIKLTMVGTQQWWCQFPPLLAC